MGADEAQLEAVFELCGPRKKDRKISLRKLESLFEEHTNSKVSKYDLVLVGKHFLVKKANVAI